MYMIHKFAELDNWENGCDYSFQSETILQELVDFCESNDWELVHEEERENFGWNE